MEGIQGCVQVAGVSWGFGGSRARLLRNEISLMQWKAKNAGSRAPALRRVGFVCMIESMTFQIPALGLALITALISATPGFAAQNRIAPDSPPGAGKERPVTQGIMDNDTLALPRVEQPLEAVSSTLFHDVPAVSGRYTFRGKTFMPYLGAGFSGGHASELHRSIGEPPSIQSDAGLRNQIGQGYAPNEFQMGIRIPF